MNYSSASCVVFQRCSVIAADTLLVYAAYRCISGPAAQLLSPSTRLTIFLLVVFNVGLLLVDHVHFQYNGALLGLLLLCADSVQRGQDSRLALYFSVLVLAKHLFATLAPVVGVFLLRRALDRSVLSRSQRLSLPHLATILASHAAAVALCLGAAFGPFVALGGVEQLRQMMTRLFPFARGLVHAYWAPNCWALYCAADKLLALLAQRYPEAARPLLRRLPWTAAAAGGSATTLPPSTSGLVGDFALHVLPRVTATHCLLLVLLASAPAVVRLLVVRPATASKQRWQRQQFVLALRALVYASLSSFMLGYHVHEKALLPAWLLQSLLVAESPSDRVVFCLLSAAGSVALFPLLPGPFEWCVKGASRRIACVAVAVRRLTVSRCVSVSRSRAHRRLPPARVVPPRHAPRAAAHPEGPHGVLRDAGAARVLHGRAAPRGLRRPPALPAADAHVVLLRVHPAHLLGHGARPAARRLAPPAPLYIAIVVRCMTPPRKSRRDCRLRTHVLHAQAPTASPARLEGRTLVCVDWRRRH